MVNVEGMLAVATWLLKPWTQESQTPEPNRLDVWLDPADLPAGVGALVHARWGYLSAITELDPGVDTGQLEVLYHFCAGPAVVTLRVRTPREGAAVPSICSLIPSASIFERELMEMLGVTVVGTPDTGRLFLPDEWPEGVYPLRKDFTGLDNNAST